jgi:hypothetical protein
MNIYLDGLSSFCLLTKIFAKLRVLSISFRTSHSISHSSLLTAKGLTRQESDHFVSPIVRAAKPKRTERGKLVRRFEWAVVMEREYKDEQMPIADGNSILTPSSSPERVNPQSLTQPSDL